MVARYVIFVEGGYNDCMGLNGIADDVFIKCFRGSKRHALKVYGVVDDDYDFAIRFLKTCRSFRAVRCVAIVRDSRIAELIIKLLNSGFRNLNDKVYIIKVPFTSPQGITKELKSEVMEALAGVIE